MQWSEKPSKQTDLVQKQLQKYNIRDFLSSIILQNRQRILKLTRLMANHLGQLRKNRRPTCLQSSMTRMRKTRLPRQVYSQTQFLFDGREEKHSCKFLAALGQGPQMILT